MDAYPPQLAVGVTRDRVAHVSPAARELHLTILRSFAATGQAPDPVTLGAAEMPALLAELHDHDVIRLDIDGHVRSAYPFSGAPTRHLVSIADGPAVYAMCAIDALGMSAMLGRDATITSTDPSCGTQITVTVRNGHTVWNPVGAVVFVGAVHTARTDHMDGCPPNADTRSMAAAADRCCGVMNFFISHKTAEIWLAAHPEVSGVILAKGQAMRLGVDIFGHLLDTKN